MLVLLWQRNKISMQVELLLMAWCSYMFHKNLSSSLEVISNVVRHICIDMLITPCFSPNYFTVLQNILSSSLIIIIWDMQ